MGYFFKLLKKLTTVSKAFICTIAILFAGFIFSGNTIADGIPGSTKDPVKVTVIIYPNPVTDVIHVAFEDPVKDPIVETFNVNGQRVPAPATGNGGGNGDGSSGKTDVDVSALAPGIYFLKIYSEKEVIHVQQIIKY